LHHTLEKKLFIEGKKRNWSGAKKKFTKEEEGLSGGKPSPKLSLGREAPAMNLWRFFHPVFKQREKGGKNVKRNGPLT